MKDVGIFYRKIFPFFFFFFFLVIKCSIYLNRPVFVMIVQRIYTLKRLLESISVFLLFYSKRKLVIFFTPNIDTLISSDI